MKQKVALVLGASKGIGKEIALELANKGYTLILNARNKIKLEETLMEIKKINKNSNHVYIPGDITKEKVKEEIFNNIIKKYGKLDILINNIPGDTPDTFFEFKNERLLQAFSKKLISYFSNIKFASELMIQQKYGRIINIVGNSGKEPSEEMFTNSLINSAIINGSKNISKQLAQYNITVNCINPGFIKTDRYFNYVYNLENKNGISTKEAEAYIANSIPMNRVGNTKEIASLILYLVSEEASYITGQQISVDGGILKSL